MESGILRRALEEKEDGGGRRRPAAWIVWLFMENGKKSARYLKKLSRQDRFTFDVEVVSRFARTFPVCMYSVTQNCRTETRERTYGGTFHGSPSSIQPSRTVLDI